jgi:hypothetical protein
VLVATVVSVLLAKVPVDPVVLVYSNAVVPVVPAVAPSKAVVKAADPIVPANVVVPIVPSKAVVRVAPSNVVVLDVPAKAVVRVLPCNAVVPVGPSKAVVKAVDPFLAANAVDPVVVVAKAVVLKL